MPEKKEFLYRRLTQPEKDAKQRTCKVLRLNKMPCGTKAGMVVTVNKRTEDKCMSHFIQEYSKIKDDPDYTVINLDEHATAQELQITRNSEQAKEARNQK